MVDQGGEAGRVVEGGGQGWVVGAGEVQHRDGSGGGAGLVLDGVVGQVVVDDVVEQVNPAVAEQRAPFGGGGGDELFSRVSRAVLPSRPVECGEEPAVPGPAALAEPGGRMRVARLDG